MAPRQQRQTGPGRRLPLHLLRSPRRKAHQLPLRVARRQRRRISGRRHGPHPHLRRGTRRLPRLGSLPPEPRRVLYPRRLDGSRRIRRGPVRRRPPRRGRGQRRPRGLQRGGLQGRPRDRAGLRQAQPRGFHLGPRGHLRQRGVHPQEALSSRGPDAGELGGGRRGLWRVQGGDRSRCGLAGAAAERAELHPGAELQVPGVAQRRRRDLQERSRRVRRRAHHEGYRQEGEGDHCHLRKVSDRHGGTSHGPQVSGRGAGHFFRRYLRSDRKSRKDAVRGSKLHFSGVCGVFVRFGHGRYGGRKIHSPPWIRSRVCGQDRRGHEGRWCQI
mmetsp:Transcript_2678/g.5065  ORF Transcript_2678/g.5065 Transcript_2678/m.5065 type:complete len:328 (-) Transcript_2678:1177-2160(-)